jgi:tetratricopeptide (TPR) repeat protein
MAMRWDEAEKHYTQMKQIGERIGVRLFSGAADFQMSRVAHYRGDTPRALRLLQSALAVYTEQRQYSRIGDVHRQAAEFLLETGRIESAESELELASQSYRAAGRPRERGWVKALYAESKVRRDPASLAEADLEAIPVEDGMTEDYTFYAHAILALGFAILGDGITAQGGSGVVGCVPSPSHRIAGEDIGNRIGGSSPSRAVLGSGVKASLSQKGCTYDSA